MSEYPECDKLRAVSDRSQSIGEFLEWLTGTKKIVLCEWVDRPHPFEDVEDPDPEKSLGEDLWPVHFPFTKLLAEFFEIDLAKVEAERRAMLEKQRALNESTLKVERFC